MSSQLPSISSTMSGASLPNSKDEANGVKENCRPNLVPQKSMVDQLLSSSKKPKKKHRPPLLYKKVGIRSPAASPLSSSCSLPLDTIRNLPYQPRVSFDTVHIGVSDSEGYLPETYPIHHGPESNTSSLYQNPYLREAERQKTQSIASMTDKEYRQYLKSEKKKLLDDYALHNQVICVSKQHEDFNKLYRNFANRGTRKFNPKIKFPVFPRRTILVYISGRKHTWVALDWAIKKVLVDGDHLVVVSSLYHELAERVMAKNKKSKDSFVSPKMSEFKSYLPTQEERGRSRGKDSEDYPKPRRDPYMDDPYDVDLNEEEEESSKQQKIDINQKLQDIMSYIMTIAGPDVVIKVTIDLSIGSTKDVLKDSYILYTPSLLVCSAKPKLGVQTAQGWGSSRLTDRAVKNFEIPVIIVPARNMNNFEEHLFDNLSNKFFPVAKNQSSLELANSDNSKDDFGRTFSAPPSLQNSGSQSKPIVSESSTDISESIDSQCTNNDVDATTSSLSTDLNNSSSKTSEPSISNVGDESESSDESIYSESSSEEEDEDEDDDDDDIGEATDNKVTESPNNNDSVSNAVEANKEDKGKQVLQPDINSSKTSLKHKESIRRTGSKRVSRPKLQRIKTLINDLEFDVAPDLSTTEKIKTFVSKQEKELKKALKLVPIVDPDDTTKFDEDYFKNQLALISTSSLYLTKKLKSLDFSDDSEKTELVKDITGDPSLPPKRFKSMLFEDLPNSSGRVPASKYNTNTSSSQDFKRPTPSIKFQVPSKKTIAISTVNTHKPIENKHRHPPNKSKSLEPEGHSLFKTTSRGSRNSFNAHRPILHHTLSSDGSSISDVGSMYGDLRKVKSSDPRSVSVDNVKGHHKKRSSGLFGSLRSTKSPNSESTHDLRAVVSSDDAKTKNKRFSWRLKSKS